MNAFNLGTEILIKGCRPSASTQQLGSCGRTDGGSDPLAFRVVLPKNRQEFFFFFYILSLEFWIFFVESFSFEIIKTIHSWSFPTENVLYFFYLEDKQLHEKLVDNLGCELQTAGIRNLSMKKSRG